MSLLFPDICPICRRHAPSPDHRACAACLDALPLPPERRCPDCGGAIDGIIAVCSECLRTPRPWRHALTCYPFAGLARELIHRFKYLGDIALAPPLGHAAHDVLLEHHPHEPPEIVTGVPLHWFRQLRRGYNQSELLALEIAERTGIPHRRLLRRRRHTRSQTGLSLKERRRNLRHAFTARPETEGMRVLLVDDVFTTGSTLEACTASLLQAGAAAVDILTIARG